MMLNQDLRQLQFDEAQSPDALVRRLRLMLDTPIIRQRFPNLHGIVNMTLAGDSNDRPSASELEGFISACLPGVVLSLRLNLHAQALLESSSTAEFFQGALCAELQSAACAATVAEAKVAIKSAQSCSLVFHFSVSPKRALPATKDLVVKMTESLQASWLGPAFLSLSAFTRQFGDLPKGVRPCSAEKTLQFVAGLRSRRAFSFKHVFDAKSTASPAALSQESWRLLVPQFRSVCVQPQCRSRCFLQKLRVAAAKASQLRLFRAMLSRSSPGCSAPIPVQVLSAGTGPLGL
jgi:hypothetical protein